MTQDDEKLVTSVVHGEIEKLLQEIGINNYTIDITPGTIRGDNYLGVIAKVEVEGQDKNGKNTSLHLIAKSAPRNEFFRSVAPIHQVYIREVYMYTKVFLEFVKLQEERGILKPFKSLAKCYKCSVSDLHEALIMENMKEHGFELRERHEPLNYDHVLIVMKEYGKFHALSYALRDQKPEVFEELAKNSEDVVFKMFIEMEGSRESVNMHNKRSLGALDPVADKVAYERFKLYQEKQFEIVERVLKFETAGKYAVIGHGDSWVNNMLFKYEDSTKRDSPKEVCLLDWQLARLGSPALDLSYFIFTCTDKELRDQHYEQLIKEYYKSLCSMLRELGSDPDKLLPFDVLQEHLKKFSVYGMYASVMVLHFMTSETDEIPDLSNITDQNDAMEKFSYNSKNVEKYHSRVRGIILDFLKYDYEF